VTVWLLEWEKSNRIYISIELVEYFIDGSFPTMV
jgi:hypothetical protein